VKRHWLLALVATTVVTTAGMTPAYAQGHPRTVSVDGQVSEPMHLSLAELKTALPQTTVRLGGAGGR
jgi:DMSO/TMAO reductase YedYZ molybdopterin-dependent catalytic subunit